MTDRKAPQQEQSARVLSLDCARAEEALAESGQLDPQSLRHIQSCPPCRELAELIGEDGIIAAATSPVPLPDGFTDAVLTRAFSETHPLARIRPATDDLRVAELEAALRQRRRRTWWVAGTALAAGIGLALALTVEAPSPEPSTTPAPTATAHPVSSPVEASLESSPRKAPPATQGQPTRDPKPNAPAARNEAPPKAITPTAVPEPVMDIPSEIRATVLRSVRKHADCPQHNATPVRVTLTVSAAGKISSPQILSSSGNTGAHQCVTWAVDRLLLPPLGRSVTVTLDLSW